MSVAQIRERTDWPVVILACLSLLVFGLLDNVRGPFFSQVLTSLAVKDSQGSFFFAMTSAFAFLGSLNGGRVLWRWGPLITLRLGLVVMGLGFMGMALAQSFALLLLCCALFGAGLGLASFGQNVAVSEGSAVHLRRQLLSALHATYGLSSLLAPVCARLFMHIGWDWRLSFIYLGVTPLALAAVSLIPRRAKGGEVQATTARPQVSTRERARFILVAVALACYLLGEISVATRIVLYAERTQGISAEQATVYLGLFFFLLFLMRVLFGVHRFSRFSNRQIMYTALIAAAGLNAAGLIFSPWWMAASGLAMGPFYPVAIEEVQRIFRERSSAALAYVLGLGSFTVVLMHLGVGYLTEQYSIRQALWVGPCGLLLVLLLLELEKRIFA